MWKAMTRKFKIGSKNVTEVNFCTGILTSQKTASRNANKTNKIMPESIIMKIMITNLKIDLVTSQ